jgi:carbon-monoxide dehydrogenase small subunit
MLNVSLRVNHESRQAHVDGSTNLLQVLREQLTLTGTKRGCDYGVCGACTVVIDGQPARACLTLAADCEDRDITTIEGLADPGSLSPIQQALLDAGAVQCGFCTPGIVMALHALLQRDSSPDAHAIRAALGGNLCRCTGYTAIVKAALNAISRSSETTSATHSPAPESGSHDQLQRQES